VQGGNMNERAEELNRTKRNLRLGLIALSLLNIAVMVVIYSPLFLLRFFFGFDQSPIPVLSPPIIMGAIIQGMCIWFFIQTFFKEKG
jgi:uncharacterized integral membrane protein